MAKQKVGCLYSNDITSATNELTSEFSKFKSAMFKRVMMGQAADYRYADRLMNEINKYLRYWDDYSAGITEGLQKCGDKFDGVYSIEYDIVKDYVYGKYDYASILQFTDGVFNGISDGKFKQSDQLQDFLAHTVSKAFDDLPPSVGAIIEGVTTVNPSRISNLDANTFRTVKNNKKLFNSRSRVELYNAINKSIEYLDDHITELRKSDSYNDARLFIGAINRIIEYAEISCVVFAARIYIIGYYAYPFINAINRSNEKEAIVNCESVQKNGDVFETVLTEASASYGDARYHIFRDINDGVMRSPTEGKKLMNTFIEFIKDIGCDSSKFGTGYDHFPNWDRPYMVKNSLDGNAFYDNIRDIPIFKYFSYETVRLYDIRENISEIAELLKDCMYDHQQALQGIGSPRQSFLHVIRGTDVKKETVDEYRKLALDLYGITLTTLAGISRMLSVISEDQQGELNNPRSSLPEANTGAECLRVLSYMYRELAAAFIQKARYIEIKMNDLSDNMEKNFFNDISIDIPKSEDRKTDLNDIMMIAVPDTTRMPMELLDLYSIPTFESLQMFDEFLKMDPMFADDIYFSEAVNLSSIINAIIALLKGSRKRFQAFWMNNGVQSAVKWVTEHEQELLKLQFNGKSMNVLPFRTGPDGKEKIDLPTIANKLTTGINAFSNINEKMTNEKSKQLVMAMYPSETVFNFFTDANDKDGKIGAAKYRNYVLFAKDESSVTDKDPQAVTLADDALQKKLVEWVETIKGAKSAYDVYMRTADDLERAISAMKTKVLALTNNTAQTNTNTTTTDNSKPPEVTGGNDDSKDKNKNNGTPSATPSTPAANNAAEDQNQILSTTLADVQKAVARLWDNATRLFVYYIKTEYGYIKEAYGIGDKS